MGRAADLIAEAVRADGVVHAFGTGHSEALAMEIAGRAGGLVPTNRIALRDLVLLGGEPADVLGPLLERDPAVAHRLYELAPVRPSDVFVLASNSGVNGAMVEFASLVKERGHGLVAITSAAALRPDDLPPPVGRKLADFADVVLDNGAPYGDATLPLPGGGAVGAVSSITAALLAQQIVGGGGGAGCWRRGSGPRSTCRRTSPAATSTTTSWRPGTPAGSAAGPDAVPAADVRRR